MKLYTGYQQLNAIPLLPCLKWTIERVINWLDFFSFSSIVNYDFFYLLQIFSSFKFFFLLSDVEMNWLLHNYSLDQLKILLT